MTEETDSQQPDPSDQSDPDSGKSDPSTIDPANLDPAQTAELEAAMAEARARLASVPPETVVVNHVMGLFELGAIHLSSTPPNLEGATLAIDSMALLVDGLGDRLGPDVGAMQDALANIRMAFVSVSAETSQSSSEASSEASSGSSSGSSADSA